jgi:hypothetical protein
LKEDAARYCQRRVKEAVEAVIKEEEVEIWLRGTCIAKHARCREPHALVRNPAHFEGLFRRMTGAQEPASSPLSVNPVCRPLSVYAELVEGGRR